ncbi:hypothetical protein HMPREF9602_01405 [Cutibacterium acnes HL030PA2]|nr:hypothetical protein HMPREF9602_01405 [Cutibacterium acnes HL030PA2]
MKLNRAENVNTAEVAGLGLVGGWLTARTTGVRPLGGTVLAAAGLAAPGSLRADRRLLACWAQPTWQLSELLTDWQRRSVLGQRSSP